MLSKFEVSGPRFEGGSSGSGGNACKQLTSRFIVVLHVVVIRATILMNYFRWPITPIDTAPEA